MFCYSELYKEVEAWRKEVDSLSDEDLIDEIITLNLYDRSDILRITDKFFLKGSLSKEDRDYLVNFYILDNVEDYWSIVDE